MKKNSFFRLAGLALGSLLALAPFARAHSVWIEDTPDQKLVLRFGEVGEKYEKSPGYLDELIPTAAWTADQDGKLNALVVEKKSDHYLLGKATPAKPTLAETNFFVMQRVKNPGIWPNMNVRWHPAGATPPVEPALTLDLLPTGKAGEIRVYFRGQPLAGATVKVLGQGEEEGKEEKLTSDAEGRIQFTPKKSGLVVLSCNHREKAPGYARGKAYELASYTVALSWRQP
ncbi:DUF4198 domain-containing protein [Oleiharenicola lentus]|uniref:DUF4198 domain-containing protein n=1 Tax=Oleiharenicola lentus TaxID=2508720 RepID=UPI003F677B19